MRLKFKRMIIIGLLIIFLGNLMGCFEMVDSVKRFHIQEFENLVDIDEENILSKELEFTKIKDIIIIPFIIERREPLCVLGIEAYSANGIEGLVLDKITLSDENGIIICEKRGIEEWELSEWYKEEKLSLWNIGIDLNVTEGWWYDGNQLKLEIQASVNQENKIVRKNMSYNIKIVQYRTSKWDL